MRVLIVATVLLVACGQAAGRPALVFGDGTPDDLRALASDTFDAVADAFPARRDCLGSVRLTGARVLEDRARYDPDRQEITLRIPATAPQLETSLVHELAHHLEFSCPEHGELRAAFLAAQDLDPDTDWFDGASWELTPSEQWASAVVIHVLGSPDDRAPIAIDPTALDVVRSWADGP